MKAFLSRPHSILGATLWGTIVAISVFIALLVVHAVFTMFSRAPGPSSQIEAIAVGNGYSIALDAAPAHPFLAEYTQSVSIYSAGSGQGALLGKVDIPMNSGGQVRIGLLVPKTLPVQEIVLVDRHHTSRIALASQTIIDFSTAWKDPALQPLGILSGQSYPLKYIGCDVWPLLSAAEQASIIRQNDRLQGFCDH